MSSKNNAAYRKRMLAKRGKYYESTKNQPHDVGGMQDSHLEASSAAMVLLQFVEYEPTGEVETPTPAEASPAPQHLDAAQRAAAAHLIDEATS